MRASGRTRREILRGAAGSVLGAGAAELIAGCGAGATSETAHAAGRPRRGGRLTVGVITGGQSETLNPALAVNTPDILRVNQLFDTLFTVARDLTIVPSLAVSGERNRTGTSWTLRLRDGVRWHDGRPFTADDVLYSFAVWRRPSSYVHSMLSAIVDFTSVRKRDRLTVEVPMLRRVADLRSLLWAYNAAVLPNGASARSVSVRPVGTGPFRFASFTPGRQSVFTANRDYFMHGGPYVDELVVDSSFTDNATRVNALLSGAIDALMELPFQLAATVDASSAARLLDAPGQALSGIQMRVDKGPLADVRVRQALRLLVNRPQFVEQTVSGYGDVASDLAGVGAPYFASDLVRGQDTARARSLLRAAGHRDLRLVMQTSATISDFVAQATLLQQQAKALGITIALQPIDPAIYWTSAGGYLSRPFGQVEYWTVPSLQFFYLQSSWTGASYGETHWGSVGEDALLFDAISELDPSTAQEKWHAVQAAQFDRGGYLIPNTKHYLDGLAQRVKGLRPSHYAYLDGYRLLNAWLA